MRPSRKPTGAVWELLRLWSQEHPLHPNQTQMAGLFGVSTSLLSNWKFMESAMQPDDMRLIADKTGMDIGLIAAAVAEDKEERVRLHGRDAAAIAGVMAARERAVVDRRPDPQAEAGEDNQDPGFTEPA